MQAQALLIELFTEELPPKALRKLGQAFAQGLEKALSTQHLLAPSCQTIPFATPRRLAVRFSEVYAQAPEQNFIEKLMPVKVGLDENGNATPALQKKLAAKGLSHLKPSNLEIESDGKQDVLFARGTAPGAKLVDVLQTAIDMAVNALPIPKVMRYQLADGVTSVKFVRPVHGLVALFGQEVIPAEILGIKASNQTKGHRFLSNGKLSLKDANSYEKQLKEEGKVIASYEERKAEIKHQLLAKAKALNATLGKEDDEQVASLLDEVTSLVEYPAVYVGEFESKYLKVPSECLILTMRMNQKYFPLFEPQTGKLKNQFLIVSNMAIDNPSQIIEGNERVVRPRLADAEFFFDTDRKQSLESRVSLLGNIVYHNKLGSQLERVERIRRIAKYLAKQLNADESLADRAALLAKADLTSSMVGEFPELQGIMGSYYAQHDGESPAVAKALADQYRVRFDEPINSENITSVILFMADRLETLVGIWGIGLKPTGERDPFGLRRAALGLISAVEALCATGKFDSKVIHLTELLSFVQESFTQLLEKNTVHEVNEFIMERYRNQLSNEADRSAVDAVLAVQPPLMEVLRRVRAVEEFKSLPEAQSLVAANKRISNLLKKVEGQLPVVDAQLFQEPAETALYESLQTIAPQAMQAFEQGDFGASLKAMAGIKDIVDKFFDDVMVMVEDVSIKVNRLALLVQLHQLMNQVADISRLSI